LAGSVYLQGALSLGIGYKWKAAVQQRYMADTNGMRLAGHADYRPLTGPVSLPTVSSAAAVSLLTGQLGVAVNNVSSTSTLSLPLPTSLNNYQLYPGGPIYKVAAISNNPQNVTLGPDPQKNPLGLYFNAADIQIGSNVSITGTLIGGGNVTLAGTNVIIQPVNLPALAGTSAPVRLPVLAAAKNLTCGYPLGVKATGTVIAGGQFLVSSNSQQAALTVTGHLFAGSVSIQVRSEWKLGKSTWTLYYNTFVAQLTKPLSARIPFFPLWLSGVGLNPIPALTVSADPTVLVGQWQDLTAGPVYVVHPADGGLRWSLLSWTDDV